MIKKLFFLLICSWYVFGEGVLIRHNWVDLSFVSSKEGLMAGATTATAKGYSALFVNPAGIGSNYAAGIYYKTVTLETKNENKEVIREIEQKDTAIYGAYYKYFVVEHNSKLYSAAGLGYGYESRFGLFSAGVSYSKDNTASSEEEKRQIFAKGDFYTFGVQWQKSFVQAEDFYALYIGASIKGKGINMPSDKKVGVASPKITRFGLGFETNIYATSLLLSIDINKQEWSDISEKLSITAYGAKWMIFDNFAISYGISEGTYSSDKFDKTKTVGGGVELGFALYTFSAAALKKEVTDKDGNVFLEENSVHLDASLSF